MYPKFLDNRGKNYITHVMLYGERIIPTNSFEIGKNEYLLLEILKSTENTLFLKILGIKGSNFGKRYFVPKEVFEQKSLGEIKEILKDYQH